MIQFFYISCTSTKRSWIIYSTKIVVEKIPNSNIVTCGKLIKTTGDQVQVFDILGDDNGVIYDHSHHDDDSGQGDAVDCEPYPRSANDRKAESERNSHRDPNSRLPVEEN